MEIAELIGPLIVLSIFGIPFAYIVKQKFSNYEGLPTYRTVREKLDIFSQKVGTSSSSVNFSDCTVFSIGESETYMTSFGGVKAVEMKDNEDSLLAVNQGLNTFVGSFSRTLVRVGETELEMVENPLKLYFRLNGDEIATQYMGPLSSVRWGTKYLHRTHIKAKWLDSMYNIETNSAIYSSREYEGKELSSSKREHSFSITEVSTDREIADIVLESGLVIDFKNPIDEREKYLTLLISLEVLLKLIGSQKRLYV
jgi:hypothetical protein